MPADSAKRVETHTVTAPAGGSFLVQAPSDVCIFTVENLDEEQRAFAAEAQRFMDKEFYPRERRLESKDGKAAREMIGVLKKACEIGRAHV